MRNHYTIYSSRESKDEIGADYTAAIFSSTKDLYRIKSQRMNVTPTSCIIEHGLAYHILVQYRSEAEDDSEL